MAKEIAKRKVGLDLDISKFSRNAKTAEELLDNLTEGRTLSLNTVVNIDGAQQVLQKILDQKTVSIKTAVDVKELMGVMEGAITEFEGRGSDVLARLNRKLLDNFRSDFNNVEFRLEDGTLVHGYNAAISQAEKLIKVNKEQAKSIDNVTAHTQDQIKIIDKQTDALAKQGQQIDKNVKKTLSMTAAIRRYNTMMHDVGREEYEVGGEFENSKNWNIRDLVSRSQMLLDTYHQEGHVNYEQKNEGEIGKKYWESETGKLTRFINRFLPYISDVTTTENHGSQYDNTPKIEQTIEKQKELTVAVEGTTKAKEKEQKTIKKTAAISQQENEQRINELKKIIKNQEDWVKYLNRALDKSNFQTSGKKEATEQLRLWTNKLAQHRQNNYADYWGQYPEEMTEVSWMHAYQEAKKQGVADSTLTRYRTDAEYDYTRNLQTLEKAYDFSTKSLENANNELRIIEDQIKIRKEQEILDANKNVQKLTSSYEGLAEAVERYSAVNQKMWAAYKNNSSDFNQLVEERNAAIDVIAQMFPKTASDPLYERSGIAMRLQAKEFANFPAEDTLGYLETMLGKADSELEKKQNTDTFQKVTQLLNKYGDGTDVVFGKIPDIKANFENVQEVYDQLIAKEKEYLDSGAKSVAAFRERKLFLERSVELTEQLKDNEQFMQQRNHLLGMVTEGIHTSENAMQTLSASAQAILVPEVTSSSSDELQQQISKLRDFTQEEMSAMMNGVNLDKFLKDLGVADDKVDELKQKFISLMKVTRDTLMFGISDIDSNTVLENFIDDCIKSGSILQENTKYLQEFRDFMSNKKLKYDDSIKAEYGDDWSSVYGQFRNHLRKGGAGVSSVDTLMMELVDLFPGQFNEKDLAEPIQNQFKKIIDVWREARSEFKSASLETVNIPNEYKDIASDNLYEAWGHAGTNLSQYYENARIEQEKLLKSSENVTTQIKSQVQAEQNAAQAAQDTAAFKKEQEEIAANISKHIESQNAQSGNKNQRETAQDIIEKDVEDALSKLRNAANNQTTLFNFKGVFDSDDLLDQFSGMAQRIGDQADFTVQSVQVKDSAATVKLYNDELKLTVDQTYKLTQASKDAEATLKLVGQSFKQNVKALNEDSFDAEGFRARATAAVEKVKSSLHGLEYDLTALENAAGNISSKEDFAKFNNQLKAAQDNIQAIKNATVSKSSMNQLANMQRDMQNANIELETMRLKLQKLGNIDGVDKASKMIDDMSASLKEFNSAKGAQGQQEAYSKYSSTRSSFKAQLEYLNQVKSLGSSPDVDPVKQQYQSVLDTITKINDINNRIADYQKKDAGSGILAQYIGPLQQERQALLLELEGVKQDINNVLGDSFIQGDKKITLPLANSIGADVGIIEDFLNNAKTQTSLTTEEVEKLVRVFQKAQDIDVSFLGDKLQQNKEQIKQVQRETQYFSDKTKFTQTLNIDDIQKIESTGSTAKQTLEELAQSIAKNSDGAIALTKNFTQSADGIARLDFSVFDKNTNSLRDFRIELGTATGQIGVYETTVNKALSNIEKASNQLGKTEGLISSLKLSGIDMDQSSIQRLISARNNLSGEASKGDAADQTLLTQYIRDAKLATAEVEKLYKQWMQFKNLIDDGNAINLGSIDKSGDQIKQISDSIHKWASDNNMTVESIGKLNTKTNTLTFTLRDADGSLREFSVDIGNLGKQIIAQQTRVTEYTSLWDRFKASISKTGKQLLTAFVGVNVFYKVFAEIRKGYQYVKEIDLAMTELKKVTDETEASYKKFLETASKTAGTIGSTVSDFTEATANFARLGYSMDESAKMAEAAIVYKNVADGLDTVEESTESIISTMKAFGIESDDTMSIIDRFNEVGNNFAITSAGIGEALQRSASALYEAGNTIDESVALVTAANSVIQNPEQVGTALKTLSLRIRGVKTELEDAGLETEGMAETTAQLQAKLKALTGGKVDIMLNADEFKSTTQILREMAVVWEDMTDVQQAAALELIGGKRQANILASVIKNFDTVESVIETSMNSQGSAMAENEQHLDSIQGKTELLTNSMQTLWNNALSSDFLKFLLDIANGFVQITDNVGLLNTVIAILIAKSAFSKNGILNGFIQDIIIGTSTLKGSLKDIFTSFNFAAAGAKLLTGVLTGLASALIGLAIGKVIEGLDKLIVTSKEAAEAAEKALSSYDEFKKSLMSQKQTIDELSASYERLSKGVDFNTNENIDLATESYEEYLGICNDIADMYPELVTGYDAQGNAILSLKGNVDLLTQAYNEAAQAARQQVIASSDDIFDTFKNSYSSDALTTFDNTGLSQQLKLAKELQKLISNASDDEIKEFFSELQSGTGIEIDGDNYTNLELMDTLKAIGIKTNALNMAEWQNAWTGAIDVEKFKEKSEKINAFVKANTTSINTETSKIKSLMDAYLGEDLDYNSLGARSKSLISQIVSGLDAEFINSFDNADSLYNWIKSNVVDSFTDQSVVNAINNLSEVHKKFTDGDIGYADYKKQLSDYSKEIKDKFDDGVLDQIKIGVGIDQKSLRIAEGHIFKLLGVYSKYSENIEKVGSLSAEDLKIAGQLEVPDGTILSWTELQDAIEKAKIAATKDFDITNYTDAISAHSAVISEYQEAIQKLDKGSFTMDDFMELIKKYPDLAKGVDISSNAFYGLSRNLNKAIKTSTKSFIRDLKELRVSLVAAGKSTDSIDQLIEAIENMPDDALDDVIEKYSALSDEINKAKLAQDRLLSSMEENPNEGYETRGEAMEYMKEAMAKGEIGSESNLWNVAERYGFTYDSAKTINENADALAKYIAIREKWFKQDDDDDDRTKDGYSYKGTESFIKDVESAVASSAELQEYLSWNYDETTGTLDFDYDNEDWDTIVSKLSETKELAGLTSDEFADMMIQIGQYFGIKWSNYDDILDHLNGIATGALDAKTKAEEYGNAMQDYFGQDTTIDLTTRPMVKFDSTNFASWETYYKDIVDNADKYEEEFVKNAQEQLDAIRDGTDAATVYTSTFSNESDTKSIVVTPILPDGTVLSPEDLEKYAKKILAGEEIDPDIDIKLAEFDGTNATRQANEYAIALHEAQAAYDLLRDTLSINTTIDENGLQGLAEIQAVQDAIIQKADGTVTIDEEAFKSALTGAEYTEDQIDIIIAKIKKLNKEAFNIDPFKIDETVTNQGLSGLEQIEKVKDSLTKDDSTGLTVFDTDIFTSVLKEAGYAEDQIDSLIEKIQEYNGVVSVSGNVDPLGLSNTSLTIDSLKASLGTLGIKFDETIGKWFDKQKDITINVQDLVTTLKEKGWTDEAIKNYCAKLSETNLEGFNIKVNQDEIDAAIQRANEVPEEEKTEYRITGTGFKDLQNINKELNKIPSKKETEIVVNETTNKTTVVETINKDEEETGVHKPFNPLDPRTWFGGSVNGTANAHGSWGAPKTETSLVGELGPEILVRGNRWTTVGENGAEFTQVKKGDIIFNH